MIRFPAIIGPGLLILGLLLGGCGSEGPRAEAKTTAKPPEHHLVATAPVRLSEAPVEAERTGTLRARRQVRISNQEEGRLVELPLFEGDPVKQGDLLFALDDALLRAELQKARAQREQAELDLKRLRELHTRKLASDDELARARTALNVARAEERLLDTRFGYTRVTAPFDGVVAARRAEPGDNLPRFTHILTLIDPTSLVTEVTLSELLIPALSVGQEVAVAIDALGGQAVTGRIVRIHPQVNPETRRGMVEIALESPPAGAQPGQLCRVHLRGRPTERLTIPFAALRRDAGGEFVYRVRDGIAERVDVVSGEVSGDRVTIRGDLSPDQSVVVKGFLGLRDGMAVARETNAG